MYGTCNALVIAGLQHISVHSSSRLCFSPYGFCVYFLISSDLLLSFNCTLHFYEVIELKFS